jgi:menaquinone-dependent protoporphyrinogen oxidase
LKLSGFVIMTTNILVAYHTKGGATEKYAKVIAETLTSKDYTVEICNLKEKIPSVDSYDAVVLGTGVRMFRVYGRWKKILRQKTLSSKHLFLFLSSGTAIEESSEKAVDKFLQPLVDKFDLTPKMMVSFPGKIPEKWAKMDDQKETVKPELAKEWAMEIVGHLKGN